MPAVRTVPAVNLDSLVYGREKTYYALMLLVSILAYGVLIMMSLDNPEAVAPILVYVIPFAIIIWMTHGLMIGRIRGNAIRVGPKQFPELYKIASQHAHALGMKSIPDLFVLESGGALNAFATRFVGRDFVVIHSDVLAMAEESGAHVVGFIVAHELAHVRRGHLKHRWLTLPGRLVPYLGQAYSRACEYTCDRFAAHCQPDGAIEGLMALAAGSKLYRRADVREFARQVESEKGYWTRRAEMMSTHPHLTKRVAALIKAGVNVPAYTPMMDRSAERAIA